MRKLFSLMLVVLGAAALVSCSKDDDDDVLRDGEGEITFVTKSKSIESVEYSDESEGYENLYLETFNAGDRITIDWGDENEEEYVPVKGEYEDKDSGETVIYYEIIPEHTYTDGKSSHTVTVKGKIKYFDIYKCEVTSIDVTKCPALEEFGCDDNLLTSLDVSKNTALEWLSCDGNQLTSLDVSKNTALEGLFCRDNQLTSLDVSRCPALESLGCYDNLLTSLDVSKNTALDYLECYGNQFSASAMNKIYNDLPVVKDGEYRTLWCDRLGAYSIAENKGWNVSALIN